MPKLTRFLPAVLLGLGSLLLVAAKRQQAPALRAPLAGLPATLDAYEGEDLPVSPEEQRIAGMSTYLMRVFAADSTDRFSVYVGYYESQLQGKSIHSPKNCLPGAGWEPVAVGTRTIPLAADSVTVNRYILERESARALVYYWYQGRGRVAWNEYRVKWDLVRDKALAGRSEEALVRIVVPVMAGDTARADSLATSVASRLVPELFDRLPTYP